MHSFIALLSWFSFQKNCLVLLRKKRMTKYFSFFKTNLYYKQIKYQENTHTNTMQAPKKEEDVNWKEDEFNPL